MSITIEQWEQIVEEFGGDAYKRVLLLSTGNLWQQPFNNSFFESWYLLPNIQSKVKSIPDLIAHDIEVYGDNAYLMWECDKVKLIKSNADIIDYLLPLYFTLARKTSAVYPFDLNRARCGDVVECYSKREWVVGCYAKTNILHSFYTFEFKNGYGNFRDDQLRMKFPPRTKNE